MPGPGQSPDDLDAVLARLRYYRLDRAWRPPTAEQLDRTQIEAACRLSADYAAFLSRYGPGGLEAGAFAALPEGCPIGKRFNIDILYAVSSRDEWDPFQLAAGTYRDRMPSSYLPIATDPGGNLLVSRCGTGAIFAWDHEHRELAPEDVDRIADSLSASGVDASRYDLGQLITLWENQNPAAVGNPTGHGNLYPVADSFLQLLTAC